MKKNFFSLLCLLVLVLLTGCTKDEEVMTGTIAGFVSDYTNANTAIAGATVTLNTKGLTKTTGSDGRFEFADLEPGTYSLSVAANNYQATTKQVTVYAGQTVNCDFQLEKGSTNISIDPLNIVFGRTVEQASFTITNNTNGQLNYSISNYPDYIQVSPASATIAAKGQQAVGLTINNRSTITTARNGQLTVNVGSDSYVVNISVEPWADEKVSVDINPQTLSFDSNTEQLTFTMTSNNSFANNYTLTTNLDVLTLSQESGTLLAHGQNTINVSVKNRKEIDAARNGQITISMEGNTYIVSVHIDKYVESGGDDTPATDVVDGLTAYFTFEGNYNDQTETGLTGVGVGTSFVESFDGSQALNIPANDNSYLSIPNSLVDQKQMSVSFWVKDLNDGHVFHAVTNNNRNTFALISSNGRLNYYINNNSLDIYYNQIPSFTHNKLNGWHHLSIISDYSISKSYTWTTKLYLDGIFTDVVTQSVTWGDSDIDDCTKFILGGSISTPHSINPTRLIIDNLRFYKYRCLSAEEVKNIYNIERKSK